MCFKIYFFFKDARSVLVNGKQISYVSPVRDQGSCGYLTLILFFFCCSKIYFIFFKRACYAYSALDSMQSFYFKKYGQMMNLSIQEIIDCSSQWGNQGCSGGSMGNGKLILAFFFFFFFFSSSNFKLH